MNKDNQLIFEAYKNRPLNENMPYPTFAKLSKHASPKSSKEKPTDEFRQQMPDSKEEYSAHDYAKEMEVRGENEESSCIEDLATRHGVSLEEITNQLEMGLKVEMEHTEDMDVAKKIALDHLGENPHYYTKLAKMEAENEEGDLMKHMKDRGMIDSKATDDTGKYGRTREEEESRIDPKCWKGYHKAGTKLKSGVRVNNCVKN
jgi:hypothetical protein